MTQPPHKTPHDDDDEPGDDDGVPWSLDREPLTDEAVTALVASQLPSLGDGRAEKIGEGWSFESFLWTAPKDKAAFVFRFPKREEEVAGMLRERQALPAIAERLELIVPQPVLIAEASSAFPYPFVGYQPVGGQGIYALGDVSDEEVLRVFDIIRTFHAIPVTDRRLDDLPSDDPDPEELCAALESHIHALKGAFPHWLERIADERLWQMDYPPPFDQEPCLVHGDLFDDHLRFDDEGRAIAILDWTDICLADPAMDLAGLIAFFGLDRLRRVTKEANDVDEDTWQRADYLARATILLDAATLLRRGETEAAAVVEGWIGRMLKRGDFGI